MEPDGRMTENNMTATRPVVKSSKAQIVQMILTAAILAIMILVGIYIAIGVTSIQKNMVLIERDLQAIDMDEVNSTITALNAAANELGKVDIDSLNTLIKALDGTAQNLQAISDTFGGLFGGR